MAAIEVPFISTEAGKKSLLYHSTLSWNDLQTKLRLETPINFQLF